MRRSVRVLGPGLVTGVTLALALSGLLSPGAVAIEQDPATGQEQEAGEAETTAEGTAGQGQTGQQDGEELRRAPETSCTICHSDADLLGEEWAEIVDRSLEGVHHEVGLSCHDCHGGNPDPSLFEDTIAAMDPDYEPNPYVGIPEPSEVPGFCGSCHSDASFMSRFQPGVRVDQVQEYWTSHHGRALQAGDTRVATCTSCHGVHGILRVENPRAPVYATQVAETCRTCHADVDLMTAAVATPSDEDREEDEEDGESEESGEEVGTSDAVAVDQYARWRQSVHATSLLDRGDLSAPTCNDCHGNHGATPPGVESVVFVCGQCHGREAEIFRGSPKHAGYEEHNEFMLDAGEEGCAACHFEPEPQAAITDMEVLGECTACHGNHGIIRPTVAMLSPLPSTPCAFCHAEPGADDESALTEATEETRQWYAGLRDQLLAEAGERGLEGDARFDWLVDRAQQLAPHTRETAEGGRVLRSEFELLFEKFRIGKTSYGYEDPVSGEIVEAQVMRCESCHAPVDVAVDGEGAGIQTAGRLLGAMTSLAARTAQAERTLLAARRGGVETREAATEVEAAVNAHIQLQVLLHTFETGEDARFHEQHAEGMEQAAAAVEAGREALEELDWRRQGLAISLVVILLVLIALGLKIRQVSARP